MPRSTEDAEATTPASTADNLGGQPADRRVTGTILAVEREFIVIDVDGGEARIYASELMLDVGEPPSQRYAVGDPFDAFVFQMEPDPKSGLPQFSIRRAPPYPDALNRLKLGAIVDATVVNTYDLGIELDIDGVRGNAFFVDIPLATGESPHDRYQPGDALDQLFVWQVDHDDREILLSARRNAPAYVEALAARSIGEVVSGVVTGFADDGGLLLNIDGVIGTVAADELAFAGSESTQDRYAVDDTVNDLFVWQVDHDARGLSLSVRRNAPGYVEALDALTTDDTLVAVVTHANEWGIWLDAAGIVAWIAASELALDEGQLPPGHYPIDKPVEARVWQIDQISRTAILSVRRLNTDFIEDPIALGATVNGIVRGSPPGGIRVLVAGSDLLVRRCELSLSIGDRPHFGYGQDIPLVVLAVDSDGQPTALSHRRALPNWQAEVNRLVPGVIVQNAEIVPLSALPPDEDRTGVDLGPITGFVDHAELDTDDARAMMQEEPNTRYSVVVESIDADDGAPIVSNDKFEERWRELAENVSEGDHVQAELRHISHDNATLDLGSGLLATMPADQIPVSETTSKPGTERIGENIAARIARIDHDTQTIYAEKREHWLEAIIGEPESQTLDFKEVLKGDKNANDAQEMPRQAIRTINAFLNADGGRLIIGVHDKTREIVGLEGDPGLIADTIEKKIDIAIQILEANLKKLEPRDLRVDISTFVEYEHAVIDDRTLLVVTCQRGPDAGVVVNIGKGKQEFWVRAGQEKVEKKTSEEQRAHLLLRDERASGIDKS